MRGENGVRSIDARPKKLQEDLENSLRRLQTDVIDLYQIHWPDRNTNFFGKLEYQHQPDDSATPIAETLSVLKDLVQTGKVRQIGVSNETPWGLMQYLRASENLQAPRIVSIQNPYNLLNRSFEVGLSEFCHNENIALLAYSPLGFGVLTGKYLHSNPAQSRLTLFPSYQRYSSDNAVKATADYVKLARDHDISPTQMALAFVNSRAFVGANIIGATSLNQLEENLQSIDLTLSDEVLAGIEAIHQNNSNPCP
jgi:aryl-alcohol dehydrogenase-like predicted oxidoreductase